MPVIVVALLLASAPSAAPEEDKKEARTASPARASAPDDDDDKPKKAGAAHPRDDDDDENQVQPDSTIIVTARRLDAARTQIDAALGATVYSLTNETIENRPGGETGRISDVLVQAPGVSVGGHGLAIRGAAANQVRINNVIIPEAISDPADQLSARLAETTRLMTGTLPAQFGFAPAGVISVTTKNGLYEHGGQAELFAGTDGMIEPALEWSGSVEGTSVFASGSLERERSTLADAAGVGARDRRTSIEGRGFADHVIDAQNRVSLVFGGYRGRSRIGPTGLGPGTAANDDGYAVGTIQHSDGGFTIQTSLFAGIASDRAQFAQPTRERRSTFGTQVDASDALSPSHTLRFGLLAGRSTARELDLRGTSHTARTSASIYVQDEWTLAPSLTFNPGMRVEWLRGFGEGATIEPRASLVWQPVEGLTGHIGYARYASPPPLGDARVQRTLANERDDYFDAGLQQKLGSVTLGLDGYWRSARNYLADHRTPGSAVSTPFALRRARIRGVELSATYARRTTSAWANLSLAKARGGMIVGGDRLFAMATIAGASARFVPLEGDRPVTLSGGFTQRLDRLSLSADVLISSGAVRTSAVQDPNGSRRPVYALLGLAAVYHAKIFDRPSDIRLDLTNLANTRYVTSDPTALEGGWTRRGRGRAVTIGIEQGF